MGAVTHPEPWQDMHGCGRPRAAQWLDLADNRQTLRQDVVRTAHQALSGRDRRVWERMHTPGTADLVVENATLYRVARPGFDPLADDWYRGVGFLVAVRAEWMHTDREWAAQLALPDPFGYSAEDTRPVEHRAWYVQYGPAPDDVCRWTNAGFYAVPTEFNL